MVAVYNDMLEDFSKWISTYVPNGGMKLLELPAPRNFQGNVPQTDYHRLYVAIGLSYPVDDIGRFIPEGEIEDIPYSLQVKDTENNYISKDMV